MKHQFSIGFRPENGSDTAVAVVENPRCRHSGGRATAGAVPAVPSYRGQLRGRYRHGVYQSTQTKRRIKQTPRLVLAIAAEHYAARAGKWGSRCHVLAHVATSVLGDHELKGSATPAPAFRWTNCNRRGYPCSVRLTIAIELSRISD